MHAPPKEIPRMPETIGGEKVLGTIKAERGGDLGRSFQEILILRPDGVTVARIKRGRFGIGVVLLAWIISPFLAGVLSLYFGKGAFNIIIGGTVILSIVYLVYVIFDVLQSQKKAELSPEDILNADKNNFTIADSEILKVELYYVSHVVLGQRRISPRLRIILHAPLPQKGLRDDYILWLMPKVEYHNRTSCLDRYESLLRPVFGEKLSVGHPHIDHTYS